MTVLAHSGHWLISLSYLAPLVFLIGIIVVGKIRERHEDHAEPAPEHLEDPVSGGPAS